LIHFPGAVTLKSNQRRDIHPQLRKAMGPTLVKQGRRIKGFVFPTDNGFAYAFGKPSQPGGYVAFYGIQPLTKDQAIQKVQNQ